jgi:CheY-like chemotaxis protein
VIDRQAKHLARLVDDLLDVSRVMSGKIVLDREPLDLGDLAAKAVSTFRAAGRLDRHEVSLQAASVFALADELRIEQVIGNLLENALKYTPPGGRVTVRTWAEGDAAVLEVADTGVGIPPELIGRIFDLFVQGAHTIDRAAGGLGLGLTLVSALVRAHGGTVEARSEGPGKGAAFTVRLPRRSPPEALPARVAQSRPGTTSRRVLLVEDNDDAREMLRIALALRGYDVHGAADGQTGIDLAAAIVPDVALIDIGLPHLDGYETARRIRAGARGASILLVAVTGYGQAEDRQRALDAGFDAHITKPVAPEQLAAVIDAGRGRGPAGR